MKRFESNFQVTLSKNHQQHCGDATKDEEVTDSGGNLRYEPPNAKGNGFPGIDGGYDTLLHCSGHDDGKARLTTEAIVKYLRESGFEISDPDLITTGHPDNPGPRGA